MAEDVRFEPRRVIEAARIAQEVLRPLADRDWSARAAGLEWDCRTTLDHTVGAPLFHGTNLAMRSTQRLGNPRGPNPTAAIPDLIETMLCTATVLEQIALAAPPNARGFHPAGMANAEGFAALSTNEILLHTHDITAALGQRFDPPAELAGLVLRRLFPWAPQGADPWAALLWASGRAVLPGHEAPRADWQSHPAPLSEWDGVTIPRRAPA
jgi:hypothetical protein